MTNQIHSEILKDLRPVASRLGRMGYVVHSGTYDAPDFGNYVVHLTSNISGWSITRERGQYILRANSLAQERALNHPGVFTCLKSLVDALEAYHAQ